MIHYCAPNRPLTVWDDVVDIRGGQTKETTLRDVPRSDEDFDGCDVLNRGPGSVRPGGYVSTNPVEAFGEEQGNYNRVVHLSAIREQRRDVW